MKKILSLVLAAMMIFSVLPAAFAAETAVAAEVSEDVVEAITLLNDLGIYKGYENGDMGADDLVQRYQMSIFATRFKSGRVDDKIWATTENDSGFTDVVDFAGASDYVLGMISYAAQAGIVNGTGDNKFEPNLYVKYKEAITMVVRALGKVYSAASYPWAYIQFANDNGLLAGIDTDIAPDDFVSRGVIAQLLYNALFLEIDGVTVAEKNFGIGYTTVMVTASNNVVYEVGAAKVLNTGKIRFAEIDVQGEPVGVDYHVDAKLFGLADAKAADKAVGTLYNVYYKNNFATILSAESLAVVYENRGWDNISVTAEKVKTYLAADDYDWYVTLDGAKYLVVQAYTDLNRKQGPASTAAGTAEMKVYSETGAGVSLTIMKKGYKLSADGMYIYDLSYGAGTNFFSPVAYYSEVLDKWIAQDRTTGVWSVVTDESMFFEVYKETDTTGFAKKDNAEAISAYANITVSADERMTVREYRLGTITYSSAYRTDVYGVKSAKKIDNFTISTYSGKSTIATSESAGLTMTAGSAYFVDEYRWTGLQKSQVAKGSYILYYIDTVNKELDILEVVDGDVADGTGTVKGYIRGFDLATNTLTFGENYDVYTFDYDTLAGATIKSLANNKAVAADSAYANYNFWYLDGLYDKYVTLVIVDGKVVHIAANSAASEFVIIDKFVSFEEDGVVADAWSTVTNSYTQIKIKSYDGWSVGGFDYWMYFLGTIPGVNINTMQLPFETYTLYRVVSEANGVYDLTSAGEEKDYKDANSPKLSLTEAALKVNQYGYIEGVDKDGKLGDTKIVAADASHYWLILDIKKNSNNEIVKTVYSMNGVLNPVEFYQSAQYFKVKGDFVIICDSTDNTADWTMSNNFFGNDVSFYKYNAIVNYYDNQNYLNQLNPYNYTLYMTNVATGAIEPVQLGNDAIGLGNSYLANKMYSDLEEGAIYMAVDGVISDVSEQAQKTIASVAAYYEESVPGYDLTPDVAVNGILVGGASGVNNVADALDLVTNAMDRIIYPGMVVNSNIHDANVTLIYEAANANAVISSFKGNTTSGTAFSGLNNALKDTAGNAYILYYVINDDAKTAIAWFDFVGADSVTATVSGVSSINETTNAATSSAASATASYNRTTKTLTINVTIDGGWGVASTTPTITAYFAALNKNGTVTPVVANGALTGYTITLADVDEADIASLSLSSAVTANAGRIIVRATITIA